MELFAARVCLAPLGIMTIAPKDKIVSLPISTAANNHLLRHLLLPLSRLLQIQHLPNQLTVTVKRWQMVKTKVLTTKEKIGGMTMG
jgi:hypothetical protein